jgi:hypothetical protein
MRRWRQVDISPRQQSQAAFIVIGAAISIDRLVEGQQVALGAFGLVACVVLVIMIIRFYARGGRPLDRGGKPFWQQERWGTGPVPDRAPVDEWFRARKQRRRVKGADATRKDSR